MENLKDRPSTTENVICKICKEHEYAKYLRGDGCIAKDHNPQNGCGIYLDIYADVHREEREAAKAKAEAKRKAEEEARKLEIAKAEAKAAEAKLAEEKAKEYNAKGMKLQKEFCIRNKVPMFIPNSGNCWHCHKPVFGEDGGYSLEVAGTELVTGCHRCFYTFCD